MRGREPRDMRGWRERLDGRVDRCPGCDQWRWDRRCAACALQRKAS